MPAGEPLARVAAPDAAGFEKEYLRRRRPVVFEGMLGRWAAGDQWSPPSLAARFGAAQVDVTRTRGGVLVQDRTRGLLTDRTTLREFVADLEAPTIDGHSPGYLMMPFDALPSSLTAGVRVPAYCREARWRRSKLWISAAGTVSPLHRDAAHNLLVQLIGDKRVLVIGPQDPRALYPHPPWSSVPNFSRVDPEAPDRERFPRFARVRLLSCTLSPGDVLFLPSGFWHHVRTLTTSVSVNFWWATRALLPLVVASDLFKRLRGVSR